MDWFDLVPSQVEFGFCSPQSVPEKIVVALVEIVDFVPVQILKPCFAVESFDTDYFLAPVLQMRVHILTPAAVHIVDYFVVAVVVDLEFRHT